MTTTESLFVLARDRDAWATIRGYVYQVELTILRWLDLGAGDVLELERGEDIDHVSAVLTGRAAGDPAGEARLLEQIKHREEPLTLRSPAARAALANAHAHLDAHREVRDLSLRFRYTTNAEIGRERPSPLPDRLRAVEAWERLRTGRLPAEDRAAVLQGIRALLDREDAPEDTPAPTWAAFRTFVRTSADDALAAFVARFEWATRVPDATSLRGEIVRRVIRLRLRDSQADADRLYQHLFVAVVKRLTVPGLKRLAATDLAQECARFSPEPADGVLYARLAALHDALVGRVDALESDMRGVQAVLQAVGQLFGGAQLRALAAAAGVRAVPDLDPPAPIAPVLTVPPAPARGTGRLATVRALVPPGASARVIAVHGAVSSGKTQLAARVAAAVGNAVLWVRCAGRSLPESAAAAERAVRAGVALSSLGAAVDGAPSWETLAAAAASAHDVVVLDDVPVCRAGDVFGSRLLPLLESCLAAGKSVVLTSGAPLDLLAALPDRAVVARPVPSLTEDEVWEVLAAYGAPTRLRTRNMLGLLAGLTAGHPVLLHALARYLVHRDWAFTDETFGALFGHQFAGPVNRETVRTLLDEVTDPETRDLLYRLTLLPPTFGADDLAFVADVPPPLSRRQERVAALTGPWLQPQDDDRYSLSPLVRVLGAGDLDAGTRRACHRALGHRLVARAQLGELEFTHAVAHLVQGGEPDTAGLLVVHALRDVADAPSPADTGEAGVLRFGRLLTSLWRDTPLPAGLSTTVTLMLRAYQAVVAKRVGEDPRPALTDLRRVLALVPADVPLLSVLPVTRPAGRDITPTPEQRAGADALGALGAAGIVALQFGLNDAELGLPFVYEMLRRWPAVAPWMTRAGAPLRAAAPTAEAADAGERTGEPFGAPVELMLWTGVASFKTAAFVDDWLATVELLPADVVHRACSVSFGVRGAEILATGVVELELGRPADQRDWPGVFARLDRLATLGDRRNVPAFRVAAEVARVYARSEGAGDIDAAVAGAEAALARSAIAHAAPAHEGADPDLEMALAQAVGRALLDARRYREAARWFGRGVATRPTRTHERARLEVGLRLVQALAALGERTEARAVAEGVVATMTSSAAVQPSSADRTTGDAGAAVPDADAERDRMTELLHEVGPAGERRVRVAQAWGELALARHFADDRAAAVAAWATTVDVLLACRDDADDAWVRACVAIGHVSGFLTTLYTTGAPPAHAPDGSPYLEPHQGLLIVPPAGGRAVFNPALVPVTSVHVMRLAEWAGDLPTADRWAERAADQLRAGGQWFAAVIPLRYLAQRHVERGEFDRAIGAALDVALTTWATRGLPEDAISVTAVRPQPRATLGVRRDGGWGEVDGEVFMNTVLPAFLQVARTTLAGGDVPASGSALRAALLTEAEEDAPEGVWTAAAALSESAFLRRDRFRTLVERANDVGRQRDRAWQTLGAIGYLAASVAPDASLEDAARTHLAVAEFVEQGLGAPSRALTAVALPFFTEFWAHAIARARFRFRAPTLVEEALAATDRSGHERLRRTLVAVATGLGVPLPERGRDWFLASDAASASDLP